MVSDRKEAGLLLSGTVLISVAADSRVAAITVQADVMVVAGGSGAATLVELTANWWKRLSVLRQCRS